MSHLRQMREARRRAWFFGAFAFGLLPATSLAVQATLATPGAAAAISLVGGFLSLVFGALWGVSLFETGYHEAAARHTGGCA